MTTIDNIQVFSIDGNIGAGKSTIINRLKDAYGGNTNVIFLDEPVDKWMQMKGEDGIPLLTHFYANQEKYAFPFQVAAFTSRVGLFRSCIQTIQKNKSNTPICIITERCMLSDKYVFAQMMKDTGKMSDVEFQIYNLMFQEFANNMPPINIIHIDTDPQICLQRCAKRCRNGENDISLEYLQTCHNYNIAFLEKMGAENKTLIVDANATHENKTENDKIIDRNVARIKTFIDYKCIRSTFESLDLVCL